MTAPRYMGQLYTLPNAGFDLTGTRFASSMAPGAIDRKRLGYNSPPVALYFQYRMGI
jgi:hypothetical protein